MSAESPLPAAEGQFQVAAARAENLSKIYGEGETEVRALDNVTVAFDRGQFTAIMGPRARQVHVDALRGWPR